MAGNLLDIEAIGLDTKDVDVNFEGAEKVLTDWANKAIKGFQANMDKYGSRALYGTGNLRSGIVPLPVKRFGDNYELDIVAPEYWKYQEYGVKGSRSSNGAPNSPFQYKNKYPPLEAFKSFVSFKALAPGADEKKFESIAKHYQKLVFMYGIKAKPFVQPYLTEENINELNEKMAEFMQGKAVNILLPK